MRHIFFSKKINKSKGETLVELVLYIAFFAIIITAMISSLMISLRAYATTRAYRQIAIDGNLAMERIVREIRQATSIDDANSNFGGSPGVLKLKSTDRGGSAMSVQFSLSNGYLTITENNVSDGSVTSGITTINNLVFTKLTTPLGSAVKIDLTLQDSRDANVTATFHDTAVLRGSY